MPKIRKERTMWFEVPDDPLKGRVELRHLKDGQVQEILGSSTETETIYKGGRPITKVKQKTLTGRELAIAAIVSWENHQGEDGEDLECTAENVRLFASEDGYLKFIDESRTKLSEVVKKEQKAKEKN